MQYRRITGNEAFFDTLTEMKSRLGSLETQPSGNIVIRDSLTATDPETGVSTIIGVLPDGSTGLQQFVNDVTPPGQPSAPSLAPAIGSITVEWDGLEAEGTPQPKDYDRTEIHYRASGDTSEWSLGGVLYSATTTLVPNLVPGTSYDIRLVSYDKNGNISSPSSVVSSSASAIMDNSDVADAIDGVREEAATASRSSEAAQKSAKTAQDAAEAAASDAANAAGMAAGASKTIFAVTPPSGSEYKNATTLWIDISGSPAKNTPNRWDGNNWVTITDKTATEAAEAASKAYEDAERAASAAQKAQSAAGEAQTAANGKNKVVYSTSAPPTGVVLGAVTGDTWYRSDATNTVIGQWKYSGTEYTTTTLGHEVLGSIDAGKISVGELDGIRIKGKSIATDKLLITSSDNVIQEPDFSAGGVSWGRTATVTHVSGAGRGGGSVLRFTGTTLTQSSLNNQPKIPVDPMSTYSGSLWLKSNVSLAAGKVRLMMRCFTTATAYTDIEIATNKAALVVNKWTEATGNSTVGYGQVPVDTINVQFYIQVSHTAASNITDVDYVSAIRKADGRLIVDGSIDGKTITGALIQSVSDPSRGIKISDTQFVAYSATGVETLRLDGTNSILTGAVVRTSASGARVQMDGTGLRAFDSGNKEYLSVTNGVLNMKGNLEAVGMTSINSIPVTATVGTSEYLGGWVSSPGFAFVSAGQYTTNPPGMFTVSGADLSVMAAGNGAGSGGAMSSRIILGSNRAIEIHAKTINMMAGTNSYAQLNVGDIVSNRLRLGSGVMDWWRPTTSTQLIRNSTLYTQTLGVPGSSWIKVSVHLRGYPNVANQILQLRLSVDGVLVGEHHHFSPREWNSTDGQVVWTYKSPASDANRVFKIEGTSVVPADRDTTFLIPASTSTLATTEVLIEDLGAY